MWLSFLLFKITLPQSRCVVDAGPYIVKLFDRSVDLASFTDDTPLYPICRAWMQNDPYKKNAHRLLNGNNSEQTDVLDSVSIRCHN